MKVPTLEQPQLRATPANGTGPDRGLSPGLLPAQTRSRGQLWLLGALCPALPFTSRDRSTGFEHREIWPVLGGVCTPLRAVGQEVMLQGPPRSSFPKHRARRGGTRKFPVRMLEETGFWVERRSKPEPKPGMWPAGSVLRAARLPPARGAGRKAVL